MPLDPKLIARWSPHVWTTNVRMMLPSSDGAMGVLFVFTRPAAKWSIPEADFVVKPSAASAASTMFAEEVLSKAAKATSMDSVGVDPASPLGKAILASIDRFVETYEKEQADRHERTDTAIVGPGSPRDLRRAQNPDVVKRQLFKAKNATAAPFYPSEYGERLKELQRTCKGARTLLVQRMAQGMRGMDDEIKDAGLAEILHDAKLMKNLGRMFVADMVLGNGDRIDRSINMGNIALGGGGSLFAIDSSAVLASFEDLLYDAQSGPGLATSAYSGYVPGQDGAEGGTKLTPSTYAQGNFAGGQAVLSIDQSKRMMSGALGVNDVVLPPSAQLHLIFDPPQVWTAFRKQMEKKLREVNDVRRTTGKSVFADPAPQEWANAFQWFNDGVLSGLRRVDNLLSGFAWLRMKSKFKSLTRAQGADANMDWTNFKMRRMVVHLARKGVPLDQAQAQAQAYAERKLNRMVAF